jgi:hypothetical protein
MCCTTLSSILHNNSLLLSEGNTKLNEKFAKSLTQRISESIKTTASSIRDRINGTTSGDDTDTNATSRLGIPKSWSFSVGEQLSRFTRWATDGSMSTYEFMPAG